MNIPFSPPDISEKEIEAVSEALRSGWITTGPRTKELERQMAEFTGTKRGACLNSATACMETALRLFGIGAGDEVIVPAYTYTASASVVCHVGATLKLIDVQEGTYHLDYDELEAAIDKAIKTGRNYADENLRQLFDALQKNQFRYRERFLLPYRDGYKTVRVSASTTLNWRIKPFTSASITELPKPSMCQWTNLNSNSTRTVFSVPTASTSSTWNTYCFLAIISAANLLSA